jgi:hypothetical protein
LHLLVLAGNDKLLLLLVINKFPLANVFTLFRSNPNISCILLLTRLVLVQAAGVKTRVEFAHDGTVAKFATLNSAIGPVMAWLGGRMLVRAG